MPLAIQATSGPRDKQAQILLASRGSVDVVAPPPGGALRDLVAGDRALHGDPDEAWLRAAATADYNDSSALRNRRIVWSDETLAAYLRNPDAAAPGTKVRFLCLGCGDGTMADLRTLPGAP